MKIQKLSVVLAVLAAQFIFLVPSASAAEEKKTFDELIDSIVEPVANFAEGIVFCAVGGFPVVLIILASTAVFLTLYFKFINLRGFRVAINTTRGKYTDKDAPGQITHFQALSAALSATVGLGNIAGVAVAIGIGGPGATFWMILIGLCGMTTKFTECTLGVLYRKIAPDGSTRGGAMYYLRDGLSEKGMPGLGKFLAVFFAIMCVAGAIGAGNMFQANQAHAQVKDTFGIFEHGWTFGLAVAILVGLVIIGGIVSIARVTSFLVPFMCLTYVAAAIVILIVNAGAIPGAFGIIFDQAFTGLAAGGGLIGVLIQGIKRGVFSNEAGVGSAPIAHSAVKTSRPASEGMVALLEPFIDTVVVCTMTALVIVTTGMWDVKADVSKEGGTSIFAAAGGAGEAVATLPEKEKLRFSGKKVVGWFEVKATGSEDSGWAMAEGLSGIVPASDGVSLYEKPKDNAKKLGLVNELNKPYFIGLPKKNLFGKRKEGWYNVSDGDKSGWVRTADLEPLKAVAAVTLFDKPRKDSKAEAKGKLAIGDGLAFAGGVSNSWVEVSNFDDSQKGWVDADAITVQDSGIWLTSEAFRTVIGWFPYVLAIAVFLFAFSTMISWSYYAEQAVIYLFGDDRSFIIAFKVIFCGFIIVGAAASLGNVIRVADALFFCMVIPNLIGVYLLLPKVKEQLASYLEHVRSVDNDETGGK